jgi:thioredoxin 1
MAFTAPIHTNEQSIDRVLRAGLPALLVFWRPDCQPCTELNPTLDHLARTYAGEILIAKINVDDNPALAQRYNITQLPSLCLAKGEQIVAKAAGVVSADSLRSWLDAALRGDRLPAVTGPTVPLHRTPRPQAQQASQPSPQSHTANGTAKPVVLTDATFDQVVGKSDVPVLVDFWASWCGPCRMIAPAVEQLAREFAGRALVAKLNIDEQPRVAQRYGIMSIPTLYIFKGGQIVERVVGAQPAPVLRQALQRHVQ